MRAAMACTALALKGAVSAGCWGVPETLAWLQSAFASSKPRSDGLIGAASILTMTSSALGAGIEVSDQRQLHLAAFSWRASELQEREMILCVHGP